MMILFNKPNWLKPEINERKYWIHVLIVVFGILAVLKYLFKHDMLGPVGFIQVSVALVIADIFAHTILQMD